ncbi:histidyl-tRNA synthetase 1 [Actinidia rufa]|uniref:histidine--tRNA ligase n=1 Tax=Actinidia rufa TaxID=165716 RepID=A0A7J0GYC4_9ERIC|nr:histidyl-tRNA synthetase 1 [Actinidia rufa]
MTSCYGIGIELAYFGCHCLLLQGIPLSLIGRDWKAVCKLCGNGKSFILGLGAKSIFGKCFCDKIVFSFCLLQLYCFEDRGNRRVALRPELTPSLARLVIQKGKSLSLPLKWFAVGQCWRYERMTRGRRREHYQWNMDIIGVPDVTANVLIEKIETSNLKPISNSPDACGGNNNENGNNDDSGRDLALAKATQDLVLSTRQLGRWCGQEVHAGVGAEAACEHECTGAQAAVIHKRGGAGVRRRCANAGVALWRTGNGCYSWHMDVHAGVAFRHTALDKRINVQVCGIMGHHEWPVTLCRVTSPTLDSGKYPSTVLQRGPFLGNIKRMVQLLEEFASKGITYVMSSCVEEPASPAEAELISSIVTFFKRIGITAVDVGFKVSSRKVLQEVLRYYSIPNNLFGKVCIIIDKMEKIPIDEVKKELRSAELSDEAIEELLQVLSIKSLTKLEEKLGAAGEAVADLKQLFSLAEKFGYSEWIQFDASVVRGLAYYTGIVFEGFDREGKLRAICGGGRYDQLLSTFGGEDIPACGFGFGDAVIVELLKEKGLIPEVGPQVENIVCYLDPDLQGAAASVATILRGKGQSVDLVLENKPLKWVFKRAARINACRLILVGSSEWQKGEVRVKNLSTGEQYEIKVDKLE